MNSVLIAIVTFELSLNFGNPTNNYALGTGVDFGSILANT